MIHDTQCVLVIDQGTSGSKASIVSSSGEILISHTAPLQTLYSQEGFAEQNPKTLYDITLDAIKVIIDQCSAKNISYADIISVGISNQRESFLVWDDKGAPLTNVILWHCKRSIDICENYRIHEKDIQNITGLRIDPYFSGTKLKWILENNESVKKAYNKGNAYFGTVDSWLIYLFTNKKEHRTDQTNASRTLLFDISKLNWSDKILNLFGLEKFNLPEVLSSDSIFGYTDLHSLLPKEIPITGVLGDSQAASVGEGLFEKGDIKVTMGTGSSVMVNTTNFLKSNSGLVSTICWSTKNKTSYGFEGIIVSCGSTLTWLIEDVNLVSSVKEIDKITQETKSSYPVSFIPALSGLGAPFWNRKASASFQGLKFGIKKDKMIRAVVESYPFILHDIVGSIKNDLKISNICLKADGGMTNSIITMQLISDILNTNVLVDKRKESSTIGAALFSLLGVGALTFEEIRDLSKKNDYVIFRPKQNKELFLSYELWEKRIQSIGRE